MSKAFSIFKNTIAIDIDTKLHRNPFSSFEDEAWGTDTHDFRIAYLFCALLIAQIKVRITVQLTVSPS